MMTKISAKILVLIPVIAIAMITGTISQVMAVSETDEPSVDVRAVLSQHQGFYEVRLLVSSGSEDLPAGKILVTSDVSSKEINHDAVKAGKILDMRTTIKVSDKSSVDAKLIKVSGSPTLELLDVVSYIGGESNLYLATIKITMGYESIQNVDLLVSSDMESFSILANSNNKSQKDGWFGAYTDTITTVKIHAKDSESISVQLVSYDLR